ncbi:DUF4145 domain-containing protein [Pectobacterium carotovorum]|uniref:DUF4145 domain-containing protein n=1 Tax=Pectobacterium carotovorum TaxID=554 RepID=UPI00191D35A3|nr:DUF4145 domain-containing protein [Pectobacterium carotovorum]MBL0909078.1 DUF4145 domain-containing protein [Pectobacterium carotovorum]
MQEITETSVKKWTRYEQGTAHRVMRGPFVPETISTECPNCEERGLFKLTNYSLDASRFAISASSECPGCESKAHFWMFVDDVELEPSISWEKKDRTDKKPNYIYMHPTIKKNYYQHPQFHDDIPKALSRSFLSTVDSLNSKNYPATAVGARRTLEGIFKYLVPEESRKQPLFKLIEIAKENHDMMKPLSSLSHAIRDGGNSGAHFDEDREPDEIIAKQMVELLEYLITYFYVLPKEIKNLESSLNRSPNPDKENI